MIRKLEVLTDGSETNRSGKRIHVYAFVINSFETISFDGGTEMYRESGAEIEPRMGYEKRYAEWLAFSKAVDYIAKFLDENRTPNLKVEFYSDYTPLVRFLRGTQAIKRARAQYIANMMQRPQSILKRFGDVSFFHVERNRIREADLLARRERKFQEQIASSNSNVPYVLLYAQEPDGIKVIRKESRL
jgi:hypothetical protein